MGDRPNVLLLHCHDLGRHLPTYGARTVQAPRLERLAADGVVFDRMFATAPQCSPSRASLFTGRWPHATGVLGLAHDPFSWDLHPSERHLASLLHSHGYATELVGMHHESLRRPDGEVADQLGFDRVRTGGLVPTVVERGLEALSRLAAGDRPFYLQAGFTEPHRLPGRRDPVGTMGFLGDHLDPDDSLGVDVPAYLVDEPDARTEIAELQGAIRAMDAGVGAILDGLERSGRGENTVVVFTTDHGLALPRAKCSLYDPGLEIACIVRWPGGGWTGGRRIGALASNLDVVPTLLEALGATTSGPPVHGRSQAPALRGDASDRRDEIFAEMTYHDYYDPRRCVRTERHKLIVNFSAAPGFMDPSQSWNRRCRVVPAADHPNVDVHPAVELYDLVADPLELHDLATDPAHAEVRAELTGRVGRWMRETGDPLLDGAVTSPLHRRASGLL